MMLAHPIAHEGSRFFASGIERSFEIGEGFIRPVTFSVPHEHESNHNVEPLRSYKIAASCFSRSLSRSLSWVVSRSFSRV